MRGRSAEDFQKWLKSGVRGRSAEDPRKINFLLTNPPRKKKSAPEDEKQWFAEVPRKILIAILFPGSIYTTAATTAEIDRANAEMDRANAEMAEPMLLT